MKNEGGTEGGGAVEALNGVLQMGVTSVRFCCVEAHSAGIEITCPRCGIPACARWLACGTRPRFLLPVMSSAVETSRPHPNGWPAGPGRDPSTPPSRKASADKSARDDSRATDCLRGTRLLSRAVGWIRAGREPRAARGKPGDAESQLRPDGGAENGLAIPIYIRIYIGA